MLRSRAAITVAAMAATVLLAVSACGGSGGGESSERQATIDSLMQEITADGGITEDQQACVRTGLEAYSDDELVALQTGESESDVPVELQDKVISMMTDCLTGPE